MSGFVRLTWLIVLSCWVGCLTVEPSSAPAPEGDFLGDCDDQKDNDLDGITDCEDPGCANNSACLDGNNSPGLVNNNDTAGDNNNSGNNNNTGNNGGNNGGTDDSGGTASGPCTYPSAHSSLAMGQVTPAYSWSGAYDGNGNTVDFSFEDFYCNTDKLALILVVVAEWCPNCPGYVQYVNQDANSLVGMGAEILYVSAQNMSRALSSHSEANTYINHYIGNGPGLRIGDGATQPSPGGIYSSPAINGIPTAFVIQRSDMKVIADQGQDQYYLQFVNILESLGGVNTNPPASANCDDTDEESFEPNNTSEEAGVLNAPTTFTGGVCGTDFDFYDINMAGDWKLEVNFTHNVGDLEIVIWDDATAAFVREGDYYAGATSSDDNEVYDGTGPTTVAVIGYNGATAPYTLVLSNR